MAEDETAEDRRGILQSSKERLGTASSAMSKAMGKATGAEFRKNWQEFADSVSTVAMGLHTDIVALQGRVEKLEQQEGAPRSSAALWVAATALVIAILALVVAAASL